MSRYASIRYLYETTKTPVRRTPSTSKCVYQNEVVGKGTSHCLCLVLGSDTRLSSRNLKSYQRDGHLDAPKELMVPVTTDRKKREIDWTYGLKFKDQGQL